MSSEGLPVDGVVVTDIVLGARNMQQTKPRVAYLRIAP